MIIIVDSIEYINIDNNVDSREYIRQSNYNSKEYDKIIEIIIVQR